MKDQQQLPRLLKSLLLVPGLLVAVSSSKSPIHVHSEQASLRGLGKKSTRIIGGSIVTDSDRYPYMSLMNGDGFCGAVLISKRFLLTAAHCVVEDGAIHVGVSHMSSLGEKYPYRQKIAHPGYRDRTDENDIALYELDRDVPDNLQYIHLEKSPIVEAETPLAVMGFGDTHASELIDLVRDDLKETTVLYMTAEDCQEKMGPDDAITPDMLCAFAERTDACSGDSGGPLFVKGASPEEDRLVGLVSWGFTCSGEHPGIYARISHFYNWIVDNMCRMNPEGVPDYIDCADREPVDEFDEGFDVQTEAPSSLTSIRDDDDEESVGVSVSVGGFATTLVVIVFLGAIEEFSF
mmetsp:Transcript_106325/g.216834  ORF Transcript_106325/g.216834 Transcript_106325/m.216834 type:complete len:349 (-) Transcript_106325:87-1133(-)